jgi:DNA-binding SARP family transcriptional activator
MGLCITSGLDGEVDQAERYARIGLDLAVTVQDFWCANLIRLSIGSVRAAWGQYEEALPWLIDAEAGFRACADTFALTNVHLWLAVAWHRIKNRTQFKDVMHVLLQEAEQFGYDFLFYKRTLFGPIDLQVMVPCLVEARDNFGIASADGLLRLLGSKGTARHPGYSLRIQTLGKFVVCRGLDEVTRKEWKRDKSRQLFQLLLTRRGQFLQREEIFEQLWPDSDDKTAMRDFKVALNALINALEPGREARSDSYFIERLDTAYRLHTDAAIYVDADEFASKAAKGLQLKDPSAAEKLLEEAVRLYHGHYLQDHPYEDWSLDERERLRSLYLQSLQQLAANYQEKALWDQAIKYCELILATDSCWEAAYQILMACFYAQGNRSLVTGTYKKCVFQLDEQLGVAPLEETTKLYKHLVRGAS